MEIFKRAEAYVKVSKHEMRAWPHRASRRTRSPSRHCAETLARRLRVGPPGQVGMLHVFFFHLRPPRRVRTRYATVSRGAFRGTACTSCSARS